MLNLSGSNTSQATSCFNIFGLLDSLLVSHFLSARGSLRHLPRGLRPLRERMTTFHLNAVRQGAQLKSSYSTVKPASDRLSFDFDFTYKSSTYQPRGKTQLSFDRARYPVDCETYIAMHISMIIASTFSGVASHLFYFIRGEHHLNGFNLFLLALISPHLMFFVLVTYAGDGFVDAALTSLASWSAFFVSLYTSMFVYRVCFHRLQSFPGPFMAKTSKIWHAINSSKFRNYEDIDKLHARYGNFVRTGPSEISISDPAAIEVIHGPGSRCSKAIWYDLAHPNHSLQLVRDKAVHDRRRKATWDRAFSSKALRSYDSRVVKYADALASRFHEADGQPVSVERYFALYSADTLFDLAFGKSFDMVKTGKSHWFYQITQDGTSHLATFNPIPWFFKIAISLPFLSRADKRANKWVQDKVAERKAMDMKEDDIMSWLLEPLEQPTTNAAVNEGWLVGDTRLLMVAGTDTTASTLTFAFYRLCKHPDQIKKIRLELAEQGINRDSEHAVQSLQNCTHLNAFIDEVLRLHPAVPSGLVRNTPPEGLQIGDTFIPGDVTVSTPTYTIHRSPKAFAQPNDFIPERFSTQPELILNRRAFSPFNTGTYSCVGKQLALMELRTVITKLLLEFDVHFAEGEDGSALIHETKDYFILGLAPLKMVFKGRD